MNRYIILSLLLYSCHKPADTDPREVYLGRYAATYTDTYPGVPSLNTTRTTSVTITPGVNANSLVFSSSPTEAAEAVLTGNKLQFDTQISSLSKVETQGTISSGQFSLTQVTTERATNTLFRTREIQGRKP